MKLRSLFLTFWLLLSASCLMVLPAHADDDVAEAQLVSDVDAPRQKGKKKKKDKSSRAEEAEKEEAMPAVLAALENFKVHNARVNPKAEIYIYLYSASWCGFCRECMPVAVEQYKKMKSSRKAEIILIGGDKTEKEAVKYLKSYKLKAPGIMFDALKATNFQGLPSCGMPGFPAVTVVTRDGKMLANVVGAAQVKGVLTNWKQYAGVK
ncbi:MAG: hypothetical protein IKK73_06230 [Akkermansia sp.]|nr:hypothetical protein [Akkermansia sp.]MBR6576710.1 hypothetical protein [Akkermansia sp.]